MSLLKLENLSVDVAGEQLLHAATLSLTGGELVALVGPNGAGKTTLLRGALGLVPASAGISQIDGEQTGTLSATARARAISYLPQTRPLAWPNRVRDVVALGRFAYGATPHRLGAEDARAVDKALQDCALTTLADRATDTLSGGELARVHCARAFASETPLLVADEPVAALDPLHQFQIMALIRAYVDQGGGALVVLHDLALAARFADRLIWMKDGRLVADGPPASTLTEARMAEVFGVQARVSKEAIIIEGPAHSLESSHDRDAP